MHRRRLGPFSVSALGLGCMNLSHAYAAPPAPEAAERLILTAFDRGVTHFDTAALYGFGANEALLGRVLKRHRSHITLASKGGMAGVQFDGGMRRIIDGRPDAIRRNCEDSLKRLGLDTIDLYYLHRWDKRIPIEESVGAMSDLVHAGKVRALGLSEVSAATLRRAHAVHSIAAVQSEYSVWTRNPEIALLAACQELGASLVAFSPLARGFLTGTLLDVVSLEPKDIRRSMPRFEPDNYAANLKLLDTYGSLAQQAGCTPGQLALAWLLSKSEVVLPIPGTTQLDHLAQNIAAADIRLAPEMLEALDRLMNQATVAGRRYSQATQAEIDTEEF